MSFPSTILADTNDVKDIQKADLDLLDKINKVVAMLPSTAGFATTTQLTDGLATKAPLPQTAAGVGKFFDQNAQGFTLPAGGAWVYSADQFLNASGALSGNRWRSIAAGGTVISAGTVGYTIFGWAWRIT